MHDLVWQNLSFYMYLYLYSGMDCGLLPMGSHMHAIVPVVKKIQFTLWVVVYTVKYHLKSVGLTFPGFSIFHKRFLVSDVNS